MSAAYTFKELKTNQLVKNLTEVNCKVKSRKKKFIKEDENFKESPKKLKAN